MEFVKHENQENINLIISKLYELEINDFFKEMKIKKDTFEIQNVYYQNNGKHFYFIFKLKIEDINKINNNINQFRQNNINNEWLRKNKSNDNNINIYHHVFNEDNLNINKINNENKNRDKRYDIKYNNNKNFVINDNNSFLSSIKIYKCIYYYFQFKKKLEITLNSNINESMEIFLVNKNWFNTFKEHCNYDKIKIELKQNDKLNENIANDLAKRFLLNKKILENKPKPVKKEIISNYEFYYYDYDFFDKITVNKFSTTFNIIEIDNIFIKVKVYILKNNTMIIIYDKYNLELIKREYNEKYLISLKHKDYLKIIIDLFKKASFENCFKYLNVKDKNIIEQRIYNNDHIEIGKIRNLSSMNLNLNNKMKRFISENKFNNNSHRHNLKLNDNKNNMQVINYDKHFSNNKPNIKNNQNELSIKEKTENILHMESHKLREKKNEETNNKNLFDDLKQKQNEKIFDKKHGNEIENKFVKNKDDVKKIIFDKKNEDKNEKKIDKENEDEKKIINEMKQKILLNGEDKKSENNNNNISNDILKRKQEVNMNLKIINDNNNQKDRRINENYIELNKNNNKNKIDNNKNKGGFNNIEHKKNYSNEKKIGDKFK